MLVFGGGDNANSVHEKLGFFFVSDHCFNIGFYNIFYVIIA